MRIRSVIAVWILTAGAPLVTAQTGPTGGWLIEVIGDPVSPANPSTTVRISAAFPAHMWAYAASRFDLVEDDPSGRFGGIHLPAPLGPLPPGNYGCFGMYFDRLAPGAVIDVVSGQLNIVGCIAHPANPLPMFEAVWTTDDFTPRQVRLETSNTPYFNVFPDPAATLNTVDLVATQQFRHGSAVIQVIPAPAGATTVLVGLSLAGGRRRRPHRRSVQRAVSKGGRQCEYAASSRCGF